MHVDLDALRIVIRETLDAFVRDHPGMEHADVDIEAPAVEGGACSIVVNGCRFNVRVD